MRKFHGIVLIFLMAMQASAQLHLGSEESKSPPVVIGAERLAEASGGKASIAEGRVLMSELGCAACHDIEGGFKAGSDLSKIGERANPWYTMIVTLNPTEGMLGTTMPDVLGTTSRDEREETSRNLTHYLKSLAGPFDLDRDRVLDSDAVVRGEELYHRVGCVACHEPFRDSGVGVVQYQKIKLPSARLTEYKAKTNFASLTAFLFDPHSVMPSGRMPNMKLSPDEAKDIASYLMSVSERPR
ncbi:MAG: cytochrome c, partial [Candidatus Hydrogenedentota bacterium]